MQRTALVVDDSKSARFALRRHLEGHAFKVETVDCAQDAYRYVAQQTPDMIFLDHIMPGIDGFEALRQFKRDPATAAIPVVICSSNEGEAFIAEARDQGAADVLPKPPTPSHLQRLLASIEVGERALEIDASLAAAQAAGEELMLDLDAGAMAPADAVPTSSDDVIALRAQIAALEHRFEVELAALREQFGRDIAAAQRTTLQRVAESLLRFCRDGA